MACCLSQPVRRYTTLDGLRGAAAVAVVLFHAGAISPLAMPGGYLAVDLFFVLSGFVIARAYLDMLRAGQWRDFLRRRVVRLYPMYLVGCVLGIAATMIVALSRGEPPSIGAIVFALFLLPWPNPGYLFPVINPAWSLFFEALVNLALAALRPLHGRALLASAVLGPGAVLLVLALRDGQLAQGAYWWNAGGGLARAAFSFSAGIALSTLKERERVFGSWLAYALPIALFILLMLAPKDRTFIDIACVFGIFPAMIWLGARIEAPKAWPMSALGDASYPLYCIHSPVLIVGLAVARRLPETAAMLGAFLVIALIVVAYFLARIVDRPLQRLVMRMLFDRRRSVA